MSNDPFDPAALRLDQSFAESVGVRKLLTVVPVRKPGKQDFVRVHPDPAYRLTPAAIIELKEDREVYLVKPDMAVELPGEFAMATLFTTITRQGVIHLWHVRLPGPDGKQNPWHQSAAEAAELAMKKWVRVSANMSLGAYDLFEATGDLPEPTWPDLPLSEILKVAFRDHIIERADHPVVQRLRGGSLNMPTQDMHHRAADKVGGDPGSLKNDCLNEFREIWAVDFEFGSDPGENPGPVCLVAWELRGDRKIRMWREEFGPLPPYPTGPDALFVAYYASAEIGCHLALGWPVPERVLDLFIEFRNRTNGIPPASGAGLLGALAFHGLDGVGAVEKDDMRALVLRGGPWSDDECVAILEYCESDVAALSRLLPAMLPRIDLPRGLLRGRSMVAAARMERQGVPIDTATLQRLRYGWSDIQDSLIADIDADYRVFEGRTFKADRLATWLERADIPWPRLPTGRLDLSDDAFKEVARAHPRVAPLRELRSALSQMRLSDLAVGGDGRNRTILSAFRARTGRNQPSNTKFIFGPGVWLRGLIQPPEGHGVAYVDWAQQEFGIAAALSGDPRMLDAYRSGDPYMAFAKQAGAAPADATKSTHLVVRDQFKACVLAVQYGMGPDALASRIGQPPIRARELLRLHRETYHVFWRWSDQAVDHAMLTGGLHTVFGWRIQVPERANDRSLRNFPMQANGAEMLRLACCLATERGIEVCAPVHDAVLIMAPLDRLEGDVEAMRNAMREASRIVLEGFELATDATVIRHPDRFMDERGEVMWGRVMALLDRADAGHGCCQADNRVLRQ